MKAALKFYIPFKGWFFLQSVFTLLHLDESENRICSENLKESKHSTKDFDYTLRRMCYKKERFC